MYRSLANRTCFGGHQMSVLVVGRGGSTGELVWTGLKSDVHQMSLAGGWVPCLYSEMQCIMDNGHLGTPPRRQTDMTEHITFPQPRWRTDKNLKTWVDKKNNLC